jgi:hypothetical protein
MLDDTTRGSYDLGNPRKPDLRSDMEKYYTVAALEKDKTITLSTVTLRQDSISYKTRAVLFINWKPKG